jgi:hypothetical protein
MASASLGNEEGAIQDMRAGQSDGGRDSLTVLDNFLTFGSQPGVKSELACLILAQEAS